MTTWRTGGSHGPVPLQRSAFEAPQSAMTATDVADRSRNGFLRDHGAVISAVRAIVCSLEDEDPV